MKELSTGILNQITFLLEVQRRQRTQFILLISGLLNVIKVQMVNIFHSEMVKISQELQDMQVLTHILGMNNQEEMILNALDTLSFTSFLVLFLGKVSLVDLKQRNMLTSRRRRKR